ncbi:MAG: altronate dehydratase, partial [Rhabdaerophilum sp.]
MAVARTLSLNPQDNLLVALETIEAGAALGGGVTATQRVPRGHKLAARMIAEGEPVLKFGQIIGFATAP